MLLGVIIAVLGELISIVLGGNQEFVFGFMYFGFSILFMALLLINDISKKTILVKLLGVISMFTFFI